MNPPQKNGAPSTVEVREFAYELKFLIPNAKADDVLAWARVHLDPDPHASGADGDGYTVQSLYFDSPEMAVFNRKGSFARAKYRIRRYGQESIIFLERKLKTGGRVIKRRTSLPGQAIENLRGRPLPGWEGDWFQRRLEARRLEPKCLITYDRVARIGSNDHGPVRLTVDRDVRCQPATQIVVPNALGGTPVLHGQCIVELKFRLALPSLFKDLIDCLGMEPGPVSKYRLSIQACRVDGHPAFAIPDPFPNPPPAGSNGHLDLHPRIAPS